MQLHVECGIRFLSKVKSDFIYLYLCNLHTHILGVEQFSKTTVHTTFFSAEDEQQNR